MARSARQEWRPGGETQRAPPPPPQAGGCPALETTPEHSGRHPQLCPARASLDSTPGRSPSSSAPPHQPTLAVAALGIPRLCGLPRARLLEGSLTPALQGAPGPGCPPQGGLAQGFGEMGKNHRWWLSGSDGRQRSDCGGGSAVWPSGLQERVDGPQGASPALGLNQLRPVCLPTCPQPPVSRSWHLLQCDPCAHGPGSSLQGARYPGI